MIRLAIVLAAVFFSIASKAQITCTNAAFRDTTSYPNGLPSDSLFFTCAGETAQLLASPPGGLPGWTFEWFIFSSFQNAWVPSTVETNVAFSIKNVNSGGARVRITDGNGVVVDDDVVWVCRINSAPILNANTIPAGCGNVVLSALYINGIVTPYYVPPPIPLTDTVAFSSDMQVELCLDVDHSFVSDLGYYLIGPASCGSPRVTLFPSLSEQGIDPYCNLIEQVEQLCFSSEISDSLDYCTFPGSPLTGEYGAYGNPATAIDWSPLEGCNIAEPDWSVVLTDCELGNNGWLTDAHLTFSGILPNQASFEQQFALPFGPPVAIEDGECIPDSASAAILEIYQPSAEAISNSFGYEWGANPPFPLPNNGQQLTITLSPGPTVDTEFTFRLTGVNVNGACDILGSDTEFYDYLTPGAVEITTSQTSFCEDDDTLQLQVNIPFGTWQGEGIVDEATGAFDPSSVQSDTAQIVFVTSNVCITPDTVYLAVDRWDSLSITPVEPLCADLDAFAIEVSAAGGLWDGQGISDDVLGIFDPSVANAGNNLVTYDLPGECHESASISISVIDPNAIQLSAQPTQVCMGGNAAVLNTNQPGGIWSGEGVNANGSFQPQGFESGMYWAYYSLDGVCSILDSVAINVLDTALSITPVAPRCIDQGNFNLVASQTGGYWTGQGITNQVTGLFNPLSIGFPGSYTVQYQIPGVCPLSDQVTVIIEDYPTVNWMMDTLICGSDVSIPLIAMPANGAWAGDVGIDGILEPQGLPGYYQVSYTTAGACVVTATTSIHVVDLPVVEIQTPSVVCPDDSFFMEATGALAYNWSPSQVLSSSMGSQVSAEINDMIAFQVIGINDFGCMDTAYAEVDLYNVATPIITGDTEVCFGESAQFYVEGVQDALVWQASDTFTTDGFSMEITPSDDQQISIQGFDSNGCAVAGNVELNVNDPLALISPVFQDVSMPEVATFVNGSDGEVFSWDFGDGDTLWSSTTDPVTHAYIVQDTFSVVLTAIIGSCSDTAMAAVYAHYVSSIQTIPNIITLNGDGSNDEFRVESSFLRELHVQFFDRWGRSLGVLDEVNGSWTPADPIAQVLYYTMTAVGLDNIQYAVEGSIQVTVGNVPQD
jgi:hypothetical protein